MASTPTPEATDGPVLSIINKRLRALKKKYNRILQMEECISQGKPINKEQEDVLRSKPSVSAAIDELEKLRGPLSSALSEEIELALACHQRLPEPSPSVVPENVCSENHRDNDGSDASSANDSAVEDLLNLLYFGSLFDVKPQGDFTATMLSRAHERGCCLTYDTVTDDATDLLGERDLDMLSMLGGLLTSRPPHSSLSHKNALQKCIEHAKLWLENSDQPIDANAAVSYAGLRERLHKIMASDYFTINPAMNSSAEVAAAAAAAAGNYASFQVPVQGLPVPVPVQVEGSEVQFQNKVEGVVNFQEHETGDNQTIPAEEHQKDDTEAENPEEYLSDQQEQAKPSADFEHIAREGEPKEQYASRRNYQSQRGGRGSGRRGYSNGRGGRGSGRGGGGGYQNGRNQYYEQPGNFYARNNYYNNRGRGMRGGGTAAYNNHGSAVQGGHVSADVGLAS